MQGIFSMDPVLDKFGMTRSGLIVLNVGLNQKLLTTPVVIPSKDGIPATITILDTDCFAKWSADRLSIPISVEIAETPVESKCVSASSVFVIWYSGSQLSTSPLLSQPIDGRVDSGLRRNDKSWGCLGCFHGSIQKSLFGRIFFPG